MKNGRGGNLKKGSRGTEQLSAPFDLRKVNPSGRIDVLGANLLDKFAEQVPEVRPLIDENREMIHASLNERFGPHALGIDVPKLVEHARPFLPVLGMIAGQIIASYNQEQERKKSAQNAPGGKAA